MVHAARQIFAGYCASQFSVPASATWEDVDSALSTVDFQEMLKAATDFGICPRLVNRSRLYHLFTLSAQRDALGEPLEELMFPEFCECLVRYALSRQGGGLWVQRERRNTL